MKTVLKSCLFAPLFVFTLVLCAFISAPLSAQDVATKLHDLYEQTREFQDSLRSSHSEIRFSTYTIEERERINSYWASVLEEIENMDRQALDSDDRITYDLFLRNIRRDVKDFEFEDYLLPINHEGGFYSHIVGMANRARPESVEEYENYISRLRSVPEYFKENIDLMRRGLAKGYTLPKKVLTEDYKEMITSQIFDDPAESDFYKPFKSFPPSISQSEQARLEKEGRRVIAERVIPAYQQFLEFMEEAYMPNARETIAASALPGGEAYYTFLVHYYTTLDITPQEVHEIGLREVKRIRSEMEATIKETGFKGSFDEFLHFLRTDPQFYVDKPEDLMKAAAYIAKRMDGKLPQLFNMLPRQPYGIEPVPAHLAPRYTGGRYSPARGETEAGYYWVNTYNLKSRPLYTLEALTYHEAVPGHHLQIALAQELEDLPEIRRRGVTAFVEGWALYAERLGLEAGFYQDPYSNFGRLTYEMWRACRLVVDTGMHALGWSREQAVELMTENTALSHHEINTEINRYIADPGQALAYKMGELKIRELRRKAENELGDTFDIRQFHDAVLLNGPVPLQVLEEQIETYIKNVRQEEKEA